MENEHDRKAEVDCRGRGPIKAGAMTRYEETLPGYRFTTRGQRYIQTGQFWHEMPSGHEVRILELESICPECGTTFELTASRGQIRKRQLVRRCVPCRALCKGPVKRASKPKLVRNKPMRVARRPEMIKRKGLRKIAVVGPKMHPPQIASPACAAVLRSIAEVMPTNRGTVSVEASRPHSADLETLAETLDVYRVALGMID
jgi:hypothetical protein